MKLSLNWLNEYVDLSGISADEIVSRYALTTAEVEGYEYKGHDIKNVLVGEITACGRVPNSTKLSLLTVNDGRKSWQVICGAPNVRVGLRVAYAGVGSNVGDLKIGKATLAGYESNGMCLSAHELGISPDHDGIIELPDDAPLGTPIVEILPDVVDTIFEIDNKSITHRPDLWGHYGVARELSVMFNRPLKPMNLADLEKYNTLPKVSVAIENKQDCYSFGVIKIANMTRKASPIQMQTRLFYLGINPHNFLVDLTNYIMLETGQPNHAFDARKVGKISTGNIPDGTPFMTLKGKEIIAKPEMLFVKSNGEPIGLAGIMGGKDSEIEDDTKDCVFEFATFNAGTTRKTAQALGLRSDASTRFEKALDTHLNAVCAARTVYLVNLHDNGAKVASQFCRAVAKETEPIKLTVNRAYTEKFCGVKFDWFEVSAKLMGLGFAPVLTNEELRVTVPTWRATKDVTCAADVIEEISRTYGYNNIVPVAPAVAAKPVSPLPMARLVRNLKDLLSARSALNEVHTYLWSETPSYIRVVNSCIKGCDWIRTQMYPGLVKVADKNRANFDDIRIFEIGEVWEKAGEEKHLGAVLSSKTKTAAELYIELANIIRDVFSSCDFQIKFDLGKVKQDAVHPKNNAVIEIAGKKVGLIGIVVSENAAATAEVNLSALDLQTGGSLHAKRVSKYQKNTLDFTFATDKPYAFVQNIFDKFSHPLCMGYKLKDIYADGGVVNYTLQFTVGSFDKTLTADEINDVWAKVIKLGRSKDLTLKE